MPRFAILLAAFLLIFAAHAYIIGRDLYNQIWWLDIVMHIFGGAWVAALALSFSRNVSFKFVVSFTFFIAVLFEVMEFVFDTPLLGVGKGSIYDPIWLFDSISDVIIAVAAAALFWLANGAYNKKHA